MSLHVSSHESPNSSRVIIWSRRDCGPPAWKAMHCVVLQNTRQETPVRGIHNGNDISFTAIDELHSYDLNCVLHKPRCRFARTTLDTDAHAACTDTSWKTHGFVSSELPLGPPPSRTGITCHQSINPRDIYLQALFTCSACPGATFFSPRGLWCLGVSGIPAARACTPRK